MGDLLWPGDERAGDLASDDAVLAAMVRVEQAWLDALHGAGVAPAPTELLGLVGLEDVDALASAAESGGNPVIPLVRLLRERLSDRGDDDAAQWLHRGLTSQDVVDTGLVLALGDVADAVLDEMAGQVRALVGLAERHRASAMTARTLTQHAVPSTFGLVAATWLTGVLDAADDLRRVRAALPISFGGAGGTMAAATTLVRGVHAAGSETAPPADRVALELAARCGRSLGLAVPTAPWHVVRSPLTRFGDALVGCTDAWGHVASDVLALARPEVGEVAERAVDGRGGSSTMPNKRNPVLSVLVRRAAIAAPPLAATLHTAAALAVDQRSDGAWHAEWDTARTLVRRTLVAASHTAELLAGLEVDARRMRERLEAVADQVTAERRSMAALANGTTRAADATDLILPDDLGAADALVDGVLARARTSLEITG